MHKRKRDLEEERGTPSTEYVRHSNDAIFCFCVSQRVLSFRELIRRLGAGQETDGKYTSHYSHSSS